MESILFVAYLTYELTGNTIDFQHTFVPSENRGQGIAEKLVQVKSFFILSNPSIFLFQGALSFVDQDKSINRIIPSCSYVAKFLATKAPQYARYLIK